MAFQNILFPNPKLVHGLTKEVIQPTKIISNGNTEYRLSKSNVRHRWTWQGRAMSQGDYSAIVTFMESVNMSLDSFRFYCPIKKQEYHVRFDVGSISSTVEAMSYDNTVTYVSTSDISLIEVFE